MTTATQLELFKQEVESKYQIYNGIFMTLPFDDISNTGGLLPLFHRICKDGFELGKSPEQIVNYFFEKYMAEDSEADRLSMLFRFIQYIERQVVLFDAIEDAAFSKVNHLDGRGSLKNIKEEAEAQHKTKELVAYLNKFKVRPVLTAHPTQFYPDAVLSIINDLSTAVRTNDILQIKLLLSQLGKTPFFKQTKPTPYDEAVSLIWYLENIFYPVMGNIYDYLKSHLETGADFNNPIVEIGFWPGGDRDGNPFVTNEITLNVAGRLRKTILNNYYRDMRVITRRITFKGVHDRLLQLQNKIYNAMFMTAALSFTVADIKQELNDIKTIIATHHNGLFINLVEGLIHKIDVFGFHFAILDIRQDSSIHDLTFKSILDSFKKENYGDYYELDEKAKIKFLDNLNLRIKESDFTDENVLRTLGSINIIPTIQSRNGERGCHRYIISNTQKLSHIMEVFTMFKLVGQTEPKVDIVPLFETVPDLENAPQIMIQLFEHGTYKEHLKRRKQSQHIMLGFSDGTKDGGYLMANWAIYKAKEALTTVCREHGVDVVFFDGRGGPPARGGGQTHQFYASMGSKIEANEIQLTIQGQTISSKFGTLESCKFNLEQLLSSGVDNALYSSDKNDINTTDYQTMEELAAYSYDAYKSFKQHPKFLPYLEHMSTLRFYAKTNIGSRPSKRGNKSKLDFKDLRAIPFVGSWSQLKQNVPGFYGVGTALEQMKKDGKWHSIENLYSDSKFFRTLLDNSMMSLTKSFFGLTKYMKDDPEYGEFWNMIFEEYERSKRLMLELAGMNQLMQKEAVGKASIQAREQIVLPLLTIQQFGLKKLQEIEQSNDQTMKDLFEKMVTRSLYGNINASRNSA
jgi:phosphoenolpyruvate carboxylase